VNGLGVPLTKLMLKMENGEIWRAPGVVAPGDSVRPDRSGRELMTEDELLDAVKNAERQFNSIPGNWMSNRTDAALSETNNLLLAASAILLEMEPSLNNAARTKLLPESQFGQFRDISGIYAAKTLFAQPDVLATILPPGMYMAETDRPLFYTPGCKPVSFRARHIVFGTFTAQEATPNEN
jgi:hypothetical protein